MRSHGAVTFIRRASPRCFGEFLRILNARERICPTPSKLHDNVGMRTAPATIISRHAAARLTHWATLWLAWFAGVFLTWFSGAPSRRDANRCLDKAARTLGFLFVAQAAARMPAPPRSKHRHGKLKRRALGRALIGSRLRHALRRRGDAYAHLVALLTAWRDRERHIRKLIRRLRRGLSRRRAIAPKIEADDELGVRAPAPANADTS